MVKAAITQAANRVALALAEAVDEPGTGANRKAAETIVSLRRQFKYKGATDWSGRSPEYRDLIERLYRDAGVPSDSESSMQANIRYHIGNMLRKVADPEELTALGMLVAGPAARITETRATERKRSSTKKAVHTAGDPASLARLALDAFRALRTMDGASAATRRTLTTLADEVAEYLAEHP
jgi:hypothetical protein